MRHQGLVGLLLTLILAFEQTVVLSRDFVVDLLDQLEEVVWDGRRLLL